MTSAWAEQWLELPLSMQFAAAFLVQAAIYLGVAGAAAAFYSILHRWGIGARIETRPLAAKQQWREIRWSLLTCCVYAGFTLLALRIGRGASSDSWWLAALQISVLFLYYDFLTYWSHRLLHTRRLRKLHGVHHQSIRATPWSVYCIHPVEAAINQLQIISFMLIWPCSIWMVLLFQFEVMLGGAIGHSNYDPFGSRPWQVWPKLFHRFHQRHHSYGRDNFGFSGPHWDAVFGTSAPRVPGEGSG